MRKSYPGLPSLPIFDFTKACTCRGISRDNVADAMRDGTATTGEELYAQAQIKRIHDIFEGKGPHPTGLESTGEGYNCRSKACSALFDQAASSMQSSALRIIPIGSTAMAPRIGSCGNDCNTCASNVALAAGCTP